MPCSFVIVVDAAEQLVRQSDGVGMLVSGHSLNGHCHFSSTFSQSDTAWIAHLWQLPDQFHQVPVDIVAVSTGASKSGQRLEVRYPFFSGIMQRSEIACTCCGVSGPHAYISRRQTLNVEPGSSLLAAAMPAPEALLFLAGGPKSAMAQEVGHAESFHCYFAISQASSTFGFWVQGFRVKSL